MRRDDQKAGTYRWSPDDATLRLATESAPVDVLAENFEQTSTGRWVAAFSAPRRVIEASEDPSDSHLFELAPMDQLRVFVRDPSATSPKVRPWVKVHRNGLVLHSLEPNGRAVYVIPDIAPGRYEVSAGRAADTPEVFKTIDVVTGVNEVVLEFDVTPAPAPSASDR